ncbi:hypothetical protein [Neobacillus sp. SAB-20_R2A]
MKTNYHSEEGIASITWGSVENPFFLDVLILPGKIEDVMKNL